MNASKLKKLHKKLKICKCVRNRNPYLHGAMVYRDLFKKYDLKIIKFDIHERHRWISKKDSEGKLQDEDFWVSMQGDVTLEVYFKNSKLEVSIVVYSYSHSYGVHKKFEIKCEPSGLDFLEFFEESISDHFERVVADRYESEMDKKARIRMQEIANEMLSEVDLK